MIARNAIPHGRKWMAKEAKLPGFSEHPGRFRTPVDADMVPMSVICPASLKFELAERARLEHRSLSQQATMYLAKALARDQTARRVSNGR